MTGLQQTDFYLNVDIKVFHCLKVMTYLVPSFIYGSNNAITGHLYTILLSMGMQYESKVLNKTISLRPKTLIVYFFYITTQCIITYLIENQGSQMHLLRRIYILVKIMLFLYIINIIICLYLINYSSARVKLNEFGLVLN